MISAFTEFIFQVSHENPQTRFTWTQLRVQRTISWWCSNASTRCLTKRNDKLRSMEERIVRKSSSRKYFLLTFFSPGGEHFPDTTSEMSTIVSAKKNSSMHWFPDKSTSFSLFRSWKARCSTCLCRCSLQKFTEIKLISLQVSCFT